MKQEEVDMRTMTSIEAKQKFGTFIRYAINKNEHVKVTNNGIPVAVLVSIEDYNKNFRPTDGPSKKRFPTMDQKDTHNNDKVASTANKAFLKGSPLISSPLKINRVKKITSLQRIENWFQELRRAYHPKKNRIQLSQARKYHSDSIKAAYKEGGKKAEIKVQVKMHNYIIELRDKEEWKTENGRYLVGIGNFFKNKLWTLDEKEDGENFCCKQKDSLENLIAKAWTAKEPKT